MIRRLKRQQKRRAKQPWPERRIIAKMRPVVAAAFRDVYEQLRRRPITEPIIGARFTPDVWAL